MFPEKLPLEPWLLLDDAHWSTPWICVDHVSGHRKLRDGLGSCCEFHGSFTSQTGSCRVMEPNPSASSVMIGCKEVPALVTHQRQHWRASTILLRTRWRAGSERPAGSPWWHDTDTAIGQHLICGLSIDSNVESHRPIVGLFLMQVGIFVCLLSLWITVKKHGWSFSFRYNGNWFTN